ncbi:hypothetical protein OIV83_003849 [Microbotryomycetes sp. JL201]|nr:hypothetical protein OIV83_003849 [Microbotryomycetes sp. JL201]
MATSQPFKSQDAVVVDMTRSSTDASPTTPTSNVPSDTVRQSNRRVTVRHGRGPLIRDSDDDDRAVSDDDDDDNDDSNEQRSLLRRSQRKRSPNRLKKVFKGSLSSVSSLSSEKSRSRCAKCTCASLLVLVTILLAIVAILHVWIGRVLEQQERGSRGVQQFRKGVIVRGPSRVAVNAPIGSQPGPVVVGMDADVAVDVRTSLGWQSKQRHGTWTQRIEDKVARWTVNRLGHVRVNVQEVEMYDASEWDGAQHGNGSQPCPLVVVRNMSSVLVPLAYPSDDKNQVQTEQVTIRLPVDFPKPDSLGQVARDTWRRQRYDVVVIVKSAGITFRGTDAQGIVGAVARALGGQTLSDMLLRMRDKCASIEHASEFELTTRVGATVPDVPDTADPASLVTVDTIDVREKRLPRSLKSTSDKVLGVAISATLKNPLFDLIQRGKISSFDFGLPFSIPVAVSLPLSADSVQKSAAVVAQLVVKPFSFKAGARSTTVTINGHLVPPPSTLSSLVKTADTDAAFSAALSKFFARYLKGKPSQVQVQYDEMAVDYDQDDRRHLPPDVLKRAFKDWPVDVDVPGSQEKLQLFKDLKIEDMKIKLAGMLSTPLHVIGLAGTSEDEEGGGDLLCSGRVVGEINLPDKFKSVASLLDVTEIWPDVYVYDGALPDDQARIGRRSQIAFVDPPPLVRIQSHDNDNSEATRYPPRPIPTTAFARLHPISSISATTTHVPPNSTHPEPRTIVSATFADAPLYLLPGRSDVFRRFVGRILFGGPGAKAKAGVRGVTSVGVGVSSWGKVEVESMPVEGEFMVGAGGVSEGA